MKKSLGVLSVMLVLSMYASPLKAGIVYPLEVFTSNGGYYASSDLNLYVEVVQHISTVDFSFYNESLFGSSIARIYFGENPLLGVADIVEGPGTSFSILAVPANLPAGRLLDPLFKSGFGIGSDPARPHNGLNPGEWVTLNFDLINGATPAAVNNALDNGSLRIGVHVIVLPDGSSESAVSIPEPVTLLLLSLGAVMLIRKR